MNQATREKKDIVGIRIRIRENDTTLKQHYYNGHLPQSQANEIMNVFHCTGDSLLSDRHQICFAIHSCTSLSAVIDAGGHCMPPETWDCGSRSLSPYIWHLLVHQIIKIVIESPYKMLDILFPREAMLSLLLLLMGGRKQYGIFHESILGAFQIHIVRSFFVLLLLALLVSLTVLGFLLS